MEDMGILCFPEDFQKAPIFANVDQKYIYENNIINVEELDSANNLRASNFDTLQSGPYLKFILLRILP